MSTTINISEPGGSLGDPGQSNQEAHLVFPVENTQIEQHVKEFHNVVIDPV